MRLQTLMSPMPKLPTYEETATGYAIAAMRMAEAAKIATSSPY